MLRLVSSVRVWFIIRVWRSGLVSSVRVGFIIRVWMSGLGLVMRIWHKSLVLRLIFDFGVSNCLRVWC